MASIQNYKLKFLRTISLVLALLGMVISFYFTYTAGRNNDSILLRLLFLVWVSSPYLMFLFLYNRLKYWSASAQVLFYSVMIFLSLVSFLFYSGIIMLSNSKPAFIFLAIPFISWIVILAVFVIARFSLRKKINN
ncbi:MAG: hypothetical protein ABI405_06575 [Parafilimonas sp.]